MATPPAAQPAQPCPCGRQNGLLAFADCCGRWLDTLHAPDPESLMRSRYSAFVRADHHYLLETWHPSTRPAQLDLDEEPPPRWLGLDIRQTGMLPDGSGWVEFVARYKVAGRAFRLHERSRFVQEAGRWYYLDGDIR